MLFSAISPFGPIFGKELRTASRKRRNYFLRVVYLLALLLFLLLAYTITRSENSGRGVAVAMQQHEQLGWIFFMFFSMFTVIAMGLVGPILTCTAINSEKLHKTLHVLLMTPLTAWQIVSGKLFSRLLTALTLIGLSLPVLALVRLLGGVELQQMFGVILLCVVTAMTTAALGLLLSIVLSRAYAVILVSYLILGVVYAFGPAILIAFLAANGRMAGMRWMSYISSANPFWCCGLIGSGQTRIVSANWVPCVLIHVALTGVMLTLSALLVRRFARRENDGGGVPLSPVIAAPALPAAIDTNLLPTPPLIPYAEPTTSSGRALRERSVSDNPVLWRELRRPLMAKRWQRGAGIAIGAIILALSYGAGAANDALNDRDFHITFAVVFHILIMLLTCVLAATAIAQEKEGDTWTVLLASPLSGMTIVIGKTLGVLRRLLWPMALVVAHFVVFTLAGTVEPVALIVTLWVIVTFNLIWLAAGIFLSLQFRKVTIAVIVCLALPVALYGAFSLVMGVLDEVLDMHGDLFGQVSWYMPFYFLVECLQKMKHMGMDACELPGLDTRVPYSLFAAVAFFSGLAQAVVAGWILWFTARKFDRIVGRAPQIEPMTRTPRQLSTNFASAGV